MNNFTILHHNGIDYVLNDADNRGCYVRLNYAGGVPTREVTKERIPMPNFLGTGKALRGVLRDGESLTEFLKRTGNG